MPTLTKPQRRVLQFIVDWEDKNNGWAAMVGRGMEGTNRNDEQVAFRLANMGLLEWGNHDPTMEIEFWATEAGRAALSQQ